jgi:hypothetical protein
MHRVREPVVTTAPLSFSATLGLVVAVRPLLETFCGAPKLPPAGFVMARTIHAALAPRSIQASTADPDLVIATSMPVEPTRGGRGLLRRE